MNRAVALNPQAVEIAASQDALLEVSNLTLRRGQAVVLDGVSLALRPGETLGLIGESGAGKSTLAMALIGLLRAPEVQLEGSMRFRGTELIGLREADYRRLRGNKIGLIFQDATAALNPCFTVGEQIAEPLKRHLGLSKWDRRERAAELMHSVGIPEPALRLDAYPHELSGGMQQRVALCRALIHDPDILLMDEPFGALDAMTREAMNLELQRVWLESRKTVMFITHSISEAVFLSDRVVVMSKRPGRVALTIDVDLPRPRDYTMVGHPDFVKAATAIRECFDAAGMTE